MSDRREQRRQKDEAERAAAMARPTVKLRHHAVVTGRSGEERVTASVGPDGQVIALWVKPSDRLALSARTTLRGGATSPDPRTARPVAARISTHAPDPAASVELPGLEVAHVTVQPLPEGRILVVGARARWRPEGPDRNAIIYDTEGSVVAEATLGDGIEHVFTTHAGHVWVGYFDEGVYGNNGWGGPGGPAPMGKHGLVRYSPDLQAEWAFPGAIGDCYALNIDGDTAWTCYYTDFPIARVSDGALTTWRNTVSGARALAVEGSRIALLGGYRPNRDRLAVGTLRGEDLHITGQYRIVLPDGQPLPAGTRTIGRGPDLHILTGQDWYRLAMEDIPHPDH